MQGKELGQQWNAAWADMWDPSAYTTEKHAKEKGKEWFQTGRDWENSHIKAMNQGIAWTLKRNTTLPVSVLTQKTFTWDMCTHQHSPATSLLVQLIFEQLLLAASAPQHISIHRRTITYSAFWKMKNNIWQLNIATSTASEVRFRVTATINNLVGMLCRYQETWSTLQTQCYKASYSNQQAKRHTCFSFLGGVRISLKSNI